MEGGRRYVLEISTWVTFQNLGVKPVISSRQDKAEHGLDHF